MWPHFDLKPRLEGLNFPELTCLDVGCGAYQSDIAKQMLDIPWKQLDSLDAHNDYSVIWHDLLFAAQKTHFYRMRTDQYLEYLHDVTTAFDFLEHLTKEDGQKFLDMVDRITKVRAVLFVPIEPEDFHRSNTEPANPFQEHLSHWKPQELIERGYKVEVINDCHYSDGVHFGAMWAIRNYEN